jgi:hypothetical protein
VLKGAQIVLGSADALDRLAALGLALPQALCAPESVHLDLRRIGHAGSVLVVVGDAAGDGPAAELLAELGPGQVRVLPGVGRVQAACAALGLSPDVVSVVDLRRSPLAALRGSCAPIACSRCRWPMPLRPSRWRGCWWTPALPAPACGSASLPVASCRPGPGWPPSWPSCESFEPRAVLIVATGPSAGLFAELPGIARRAWATRPTPRCRWRRACWRWPGCSPPPGKPAGRSPTAKPAWPSNGRGRCRRRACARWASTPACWGW